MGLMADWLRALPDQLISERERLFPVASKFAKRIGVVRSRLSHLEKTKYKGAKWETILRALEALEYQSNFSPAMNDKFTEALTDKGSSDPE
jgi:hypothetical protein